MAGGQGHPGDNISMRRSGNTRRTFQKRKSRDWSETVNLMGRVVSTGQDSLERGKCGMRVLVHSQYHKDPEIEALARFLEAVEVGKLGPTTARGPHGETYAEALTRLFIRTLGVLKLKLHSWAFMGLISEREYWAIVRCFDRGKV